MDYPKRPPFFAMKFCRLLAKACAAQEFGGDVAWLLTIIVTTEDAAHYRRPVTYFNSNLMDMCGYKSEASLRRARDRAVEAGWLVYDAGSKWAPGRYFVRIPGEADTGDDMPSDEGADVDSTLNFDGRSDADPTLSRRRTDADPTLSRRRADAEPAPFIPIPIPEPIPVPNEGASPPEPPVSVSATTDSSRSTDIRELTTDSARAPSPKKRTKSTPPEPPPIPPELDTSEFRYAWEDWQAARRSRGKPVSPVAARQQLTDLARYGPRVAVDAIRLSIRNDWQGLFPERVAHEQHGHGTRKTQGIAWAPGATHAGEAGAAGDGEL